LVQLLTSQLNSFSALFHSSFDQLLPLQLVSILLPFSLVQLLFLQLVSMLLPSSFG